MAQVILLTDNHVFGQFGATRYMGPYAVASQTRERGYDVVVIDHFTRHPDFFSYLENFLSDETLVIGMSSTFLFPHPEMGKSRKHRSEGLEHYYRGELWFENGNDLKVWLADLRKLLNRVAPNCRLVLGGVKAQYGFWRPEFYQEFDWINLGAGDQVFPDLVDALANGQKPPTLQKWNGRILDNLNMPKRNKQCPVCHWGTNWGVQTRESLPIEISRGCTFNCKFCHYEKKESRQKDLFGLKEELIRNYENFGIQTYHFCDDCFNDSRDKVEKTCNLLLSLPFPIEWVSYARVDVAVKFPETAKLMVESGARGLYWGLESFDADVARRAGKGTPPEKVKEFLIDFHLKYGNECLSEGSFIAGLPGEKTDSLERTLQWVLDHPALDFMTIGPLGLMPYTEDLDHLVFDFADYSRNPEKYGFKKVTFKPNYWEHESMNSIEAAEWAAKMALTWREHKKPGPVRTIWLYPHLRTLGFSKDEIFQMARSQHNSEQKMSEIIRRFDSFTIEYFQLLLRQNSPQQRVDDVRFDSVTI